VTPLHAFRVRDISGRTWFACIVRQTNSDRIAVLSNRMGRWAPDDFHPAELLNPEQEHIEWDVVAVEPDEMPGFTDKFGDLIR
jgi:hypothetical protein